MKIISICEIKEPGKYKTSQLMHDLDEVGIICGTEIEVIKSPDDGKLFIKLPGKRFYSYDNSYVALNDVMPGNLVEVPADKDHWSTKIKQENTDLKITIQNGLDEIKELERYLLSDKFKEDTTVQVQDVLNRLVNIKQALNQ